MSRSVARLLTFGAHVCLHAMPAQVGTHTTMHTCTRSPNEPRVCLGEVGETRRAESTPGKPPANLTREMKMPRMG